MISSQLICSQSRIYLWLWHAILWSNQLYLNLVIFHIETSVRIHKLLPLSAAIALANSLVSSKLDFFNSLYSGISQANLNKLQRIQNSLARVIIKTSFKISAFTNTQKFTLASNQSIEHKFLSSNIQNIY